MFIDMAKSTKTVEKKIKWTFVYFYENCLFSEYYVALYPYQSMEAGDLSFQQGEVVLVIKKEGEWWTGTIGDRQGIFPSNYVQKAQAEVS